MKWILTFALFSQVVLADSVASKFLLIDGSVKKLKTELATEMTAGQEWREVTVPGTCERTETRRECRTIEGKCERQCRFLIWGCRNVCAPDREECSDVPHTVTYNCTRTERREVSTAGTKVNHQVSIQVNFGDQKEVHELVEFKAIEDKLVVVQSTDNGHELKFPPVESEVEINGDTKNIRHDVVIELKTDQ